MAKITVRVGDLGALHGALSSIEARQRVIRDGQSERVIIETVRIPPGLSLDVAINLRALKEALDVAQQEQRKIVERETGGSLNVERGSAIEERINIRSAELASATIDVEIRQLVWEDIAAANPDAPPSVRAILWPLLDASKQAEKCT
jgi:hypothetical protein